MALEGGDGTQNSRSQLEGAVVLGLGGGHVPPEGVVAALELGAGSVAAYMRPVIAEDDEKRVVHLQGRELMAQDGDEVPDVVLEGEVEAQGGSDGRDGVGGELLLGVKGLGLGELGEGVGDVFLGLDTDTVFGRNGDDGRVDNTTKDNGGTGPMDE
ncbi:hypothetical protein Ct61P_14592 [Colletotrichum tofieldiae]|nr:hypothetical protein Ct61P_14592 [Colletotrichum tofieldiae]